MSKQKGSGSGRTDQNGLTGTRYWIWLQTKFPVFQLLHAVGIRMYPKYDAGPKTGKRSIEKNEWALEKLGLIAVVWLDRKGPRVGGRRAQFNNLHDAVAVTLKDLALTPDDFVVPPSPPASVYPRQDDLDAILEAATPPATAQPGAANPLRMMAEPSHEQTALAMIEDTAWARIHEEHHTRSLTKKAACADDVTDMEEAVRLALRPLRHESLLRPISELVADLAPRDKAAKRALSVVPEPGAAKTGPSSEDPLASAVKHTRAQLTRVQTRREAVGRELQQARAQIERLTARVQDLEAEMPRLDEQEKRIGASLCALEPNAALADVTKTLDEAERDGTAPALRQD